MDVAEFEDALYEQIRPRATGGPNALPYLFAGSGLSLRYLGLPTWDALLERFALEAGLNYFELLSRADGDRPAVASQIADAFHSVWFNAPQYEAQRGHVGVTSSHELPLKIAISQFLRERSVLAAGVPGVDDPALAEEIVLAGRAVLDGVITTNYDPLISSIFKPLPVFVGQDELILSDAQFVSEVYLIHGSVDDPESLVLTSSDYSKITKQSPYLVAKLLTIFVEHPVVFMGYSIADTYIQDILRKVAEAVTPGRLAQLAGRLVFVEWSHDSAAEPTIVRRDIALDSGGFLTVTQVVTPSFAPVFRALSRLERPFPRQLLRQLSAQVYDLFSDPSVTKTPVSVVPIDSPNAEGLSVVFGVGQFRPSDGRTISLIGLRTVPREHLARDVLAMSKSEYADDDWLRSGLPSMNQQWSTAYMPVYKYLRGAGRIEGGEVNFDSLGPEIKEIADRVDGVAAVDSNRRRFEKGGYAGMSPVEIVKGRDAEYFKLECLMLVDVARFGAESLREALMFMLIEFERRGERLSTSFWRALCWYDRVAFGPDVDLAPVE
ncbi:SIR2 family protein [Cellulomonas sp. Leaf334]|uniref:SIR2 family protein n=1 Tax=Cellulomonas sp. Leaf334 TaxID=1736339 RepID=UPI0006F2C2BE|nr:SIR2 family protein [Cellulomonas sp. Leaf334]KQR17210.1 hypothetical protein ASF78_07880 [Cellulomonas sp. Leaf334]